MALDEGHYHIYFFCCNNLWKSKFMAVEKRGKLREVFFPTVLLHTLNVVWRVA